jgi:hypothetical protein
VPLLELFAAPIVAEIELARGAQRRDALLERLDDGSEIYASAWFARLLDVELGRAERGRPAALVAFRSTTAQASALAAPGEVVGRLGDRRFLTGTGAGAGEEEMFGLLLSGADERAAGARHAEVQRLLPDARYALAEPGDAGRASWVWRKARAPRPAHTHNDSDAPAGGVPA